MTTTDLYYALTPERREQWRQYTTQARRERDARIRRAESRRVVETVQERLEALYEEQLQEMNA